MSSVSPPSPERSRFRLFVPLLAGATWRDRLVSCVGALVCVGATGLICSLLLGNDPLLPLLVAPMGASALLLFAIPSSPLAQPWPIVGGNTVSALIGLLVSRYVPEPAIAAGCAVALAIAAMSLLRCLHPPGGAAGTDRRARWAGRRDLWARLRLRSSRAQCAGADPARPSRSTASPAIAIRTARRPRRTLMARRTCPRHSAWASPKPISTPH